MKTLFTLFAVVFAMSCTPYLGAQVTYNILSDLDFERKAGWPERITKVIRANDGRIVAVGETVSDNGRQFEGLLLILNPETGATELRKTYGKSEDAGFNSLIQNFDGTFTIVGYQTERQQGQNGWILQVDERGEILRDESLESNEKRDDVLVDIAISRKGQIMAVGYQRYKNDFNALWLVAIDEQGTAEKLVNDAALGFVKTIVPAHTEGFVLLGNTEQFKPGQVEDAWIWQVAADGQALWSTPKYYGDEGFQDIQDMAPSLDGGYILTGVTTSKGAGLADMWVLKLDRQFKVQWEKTYGSSKEDAAHCIIALQHGGYAILGQGKGHLASAKNTQLQLLIIGEQGEERDATGTPIIPNQGNEIATSLTETADGKLVIAGTDLAEDRRQTPTPHIGVYTYRQVARLTNSAREKERNANYANALALSEPRFVDQNGNGYLEISERGYFLVNVKNQTQKVLDQITVGLQHEHGKAIQTNRRSIQLGSLQPGQGKDVHIPVQALKELGSGKLEFNILFNVKGVYASRKVASIRTNQPDPAKLMVVNSQFFPASHPQPGQEVMLRVEVENRGGRATGPFDVDFVIPAGVQSLESERQSILSIPPDSKKTLSFSFTFSEAFRGDRLTIVLEAKGQSLPSFKNSFHVAVENQRETTPQGPGLVTGENEIFWTSPDPNDYKGRIVEVNDRNVNIKLMALSGDVLDKGHFSTKVNGELIQAGQKMDEVTLQGPGKDMGRNRYTFKDKIRLQPGRNVVEVVYDDQKGLNFQSRAMTFNYIPKGNPNLYVLSIGVQHDDLKYTVKDAEDIASEFMKLRDDRGRGFKKVDVKQLTKQSETTYSNLRKALVDLRRSNIKDNDLVVLFISSHGKVLSDRGDYILIPSDFEPEYEEQTSINFQRDIIEQLDKIKGKILVFIDACHSGSAIGSKDFSDAAASKFMNDLIEKSSGLEIIASCSDHEYSWEDAKWQNGAFTEAIIEAFQDKSVEVDGQMIHADIFDEIGHRKSGRDGIITIEELRNFIGKRVPYLVRSTKRQKQNPSHKSTELLPKDTPIYMVDQNQ